jgi:hypothetical protein
LSKNRLSNQYSNEGGSNDSNGNNSIDIAISPTNNGQNIQYISRLDIVKLA